MRVNRGVLLVLLAVAIMAASAILGAALALTAGAAPRHDQGAQAGSWSESPWAQQALWLWLGFAVLGVVSVVLLALFRREVHVQKVTRREHQKRRDFLRQVRQYHMDALESHDRNN